MYTVVKKLLEKLESAETQAIEFTQEDTRVALAVLLYRVIRVDGRVRPSEVQKYREILEDHLHISPDELPLFEKMVENQSASEQSLFPFTAIVSKMPREDKLEILRLMNEISVSDNELHEFELNLVSRTAELLDIDPDEIIG